MVILGLEKPVEYGSRQIFDPTMAQMVLRAQNNYVNAMREDYLQGREDLKEFNKNFGDFFSPIQKDMEWYEQNVTGATRDLINDLYTRGIDPLRSAEGRAAISRWVNSMPVGKINQLKQSAAVANEYLKAEQDLRRKGLYDPRLVKYEGPSLSEYSTLGDENTQAMGIFERTSPTPIKDLATFGNPYFEGMKPNIHKRSKNGVTYSEESITMDDLKAIADSKYNELINTPQGQLMHKYYRDLTGSEEGARDMFNQAIANAQQRRTYIKDDYEDNYFKRQQLALQYQSNQLSRNKLDWEKQKHRLEHPELYGDGGGNGPAPGQEGFSWVGRTYEDFVANAASDGTTNYSWYDVSKSYDAINKSIGQTQINFGKQFVGKNNMDAETVNKKLRQLSLDLHYGNISDYQYKTQKEGLLAQKGGYGSVKNAYQSRFGRKIDPGTFVAWHGGETLSDNKNVIVASGYDLNRLYDQDDIVTSTMGYTKKHRGSTQTLRNIFKQNSDGTEKDANGITISPTGRGYGAIQKDGAFHVYVEVKVKDADNTRTCYYDLGVQSPSRRGGAYTGNLKDRQLVTTSGSIIGKRTPFSGTSEGFVPRGDLRYNFNWNAPGEEFNLYPDYSLWGDYGPGDVRANAYLKAKATEYNSGY